MEEYIKKVVEFNKTSGFKQEESFEFNDMMKLKLGLIQEELNELYEAYENKDKVAALDAYADLLYVLFGAAWSSKMDDVLETALSRVHDSNMSKFPRSISEAERTVAKYNASGIATSFKKVGDIYVVYNRDTGKILKSINYNPVQLNDLV